MPGATATNIRKADLAEDLGNLLLRNFCAIAPISKADDFGIDTIATLLEIDSSSHLRELADKTFGIQFKAKSVRKIEFLKDYEYNWLLNLNYPYFVGSVDINNTKMEIYSLHLVSAMPSINENCDGLIICLDDESESVNGILKLNLGDPIITLSTEDIQDKKLLEKKREILKKWILGEYENIKVRDIGLTKAFKWETNKMPQLDAVNKIFTNSENKNIYDQSFDFIDATLTELKLFNESKELDESIDIINSILLRKGIELFLTNNFDFNNYRNKIKNT
ncbi:hypothetical protein [Aquimarina sp. AU119]|uniref:hypothetical protein n=1 Tax=Aquimarina sp. AU119 TaxID=2108528 RepID=UPI000D699947|nr:hypothetical protein [Aquimarina sp. AU119]